MVQTEHDRSAVERRYETGVTMQLIAITLRFAIEEGRDVGAFVAAGLEVDDPAHAAVDERAVENHVRDGAAVDPGQRPFAARVVMPGGMR